MARPNCILWFERLLGFALLLDLGNNLASWQAIGVRLAAQGLPASPLLIGLVAAIPTLVGAILLYLVARRRSRIARWVVTLLVVAGTIGFAALILGSGARWTPSFTLAGVAELIKLVAVTRLFTREAAAWFAKVAPSTDADHSPPRS